MQTSSCEERRERHGLRPGQRKIIRAIAEALLSDADEDGKPMFPDGGWLDQVVDELDLSIGAGSPDIRRGFFALTMLIESLPAVVIGSVRRMSQLPLSERIAYLEALERSRIGLMGTLLVAFKIPITMIAYDFGDGLKLTGFDRQDLSSRRGVAPIRKPKGTLIRRAAARGAP